ncbi:hypothetical protein HPB50_023956 [Hyalomma asiaticum]|uniref:Uncharacterized protein n=1 Tax=Hyalomma asiaticum TaxID=266040 RepID=A0ACB7S4Y9_HYAAI|nr:hypothetical protein HPB50_023956 [Hyalomma asiaticum]
MSRLILEKRLFILSCVAETVDEVDEQKVLCPKDDQLKVKAPRGIVLLPRSLIRGDGFNGIAIAEPPTDTENDAAAEANPKSAESETCCSCSVGVVSPKACSVCSATTGLFIDYLESGRSKEGLVRIARGVCTFLKFASAGACANVIDMYKDELFYIAKNRKAPRAETCSVLFGSLCGPLTSDVHNWTVQISGPPSKRHLDEEVTSVRLFEQPPLRALRAS